MKYLTPDFYVQIAQLTLLGILVYYKIQEFSQIKHTKNFTFLKKRIVRKWGQFVGLFKRKEK